MTASAGHKFTINRAPRAHTMGSGRPRLTAVRQPGSLDAEQGGGGAQRPRGYPALLSARLANIGLGSLRSNQCAEE